MFRFIARPVLGKIIESRIKSALADDDLNKTRLKQWIAVANGGQFSSASWNYQFENGKSLVDFAVERANDLLIKTREKSRPCLSPAGGHSNYTCQGT
ncbi:MAG: hypothetical protein LCH30_02280 [Proteobacteria bacterium]|nr:hypothetical protein [Pseudomonadota bacterium]